MYVLCVLSLENCVHSGVVRICTYGTAHIQVYKQMCVTHRDSRNFEDNSRVWLV